MVATPQLPIFHDGYYLSNVFHQLIGEIFSTQACFISNNFFARLNLQYLFFSGQIISNQLIKRN